MSDLLPQEGWPVSLIVSPLSVNVQVARRSHLDVNGSRLVFARCFWTWTGNCSGVKGLWVRLWWMPSGCLYICSRTRGEIIPRLTSVSIWCEIPAPVPNCIWKTKLQGQLIVIHLTFILNPLHLLVLTRIYVILFRVRIRPFLLKHELKINKCFEFSPCVCKYPHSTSPILLTQTAQCVRLPKLDAILLW